MSEGFEGKNLVELLDMLEPVPDPAPVSLMPQTAGWAIVGLVFLALTFWVAQFVVSRRNARAYRRAALRELATVGDDAAQIADLLRRTALAGFPRESVAGLTGTNWLNFLNQSYGGKGFSGPMGATLLAAPYRDSAKAPELTNLARQWITTHRQPRS